MRDAAEQEASRSSASEQTIVNEPDPDQGEADQKNP
jgi:hypothetical protein